MFSGVFLVASRNILGTCLSLCTSIAYSHGPLLVRRVFTNHHTSVIQTNVFHYTQLCVCVSVYMCVYVYVSSINARFEELSATSFPEEFPYVAKSVFAFVEIDGQDVCFFGMIVHEFDSDCPEPNRR